MRIACLGNMNNNMFVLARYLRDMGHDAHLFLFSNEFGHFSPSADTYTDEYLGYTTQLSWGAEDNFDKTDPATVRADLDGFDALMGCNYAPGFLAKAGLKLDLFIPHGSDYYEVPYYTDKAGNPTPLARAQARGIREAANIMVPRTNAAREKYWRPLGPTGTFHWTASPSVYRPGYSPEAIAAFHRPGPADELLRRVRANHAHVLLQHARQCWSTPGLENDHKGNDILLRGLAEYARESGPDFGAILVEYGPDVDASKALIADLGIDDAVYWLPRMERRELMPVLAGVDVVAAEFAYSWIASGALYEAMAMDKPILARRDDEFYGDMPLFPMMRAAFVHEVKDRLTEFHRDPAAHAAVGAGGGAWFRSEVEDRALAVLSGVFGPGA